MLPCISDNINKVILALMQKFSKPKLLNNVSIVGLIEGDCNNLKISSSYGKKWYGFYYRKTD